MQCTANLPVEFWWGREGLAKCVGADEEMEDVDAEEDAQPLPSDMFMAG